MASESNQQSVAASAVEPVAIATRTGTIAALFHSPAGEATGRGVVLCPPWGWDEVASYRPRRRWAERLAAEGHSVLRFDLVGTGDSAGGPADADQVDAWAASIEACAGWIREHGVTRLAVIGLGLGGLLACECIRRGMAVDELIIWGSPPDGRAFARELKAFARLQSGKATADGGEPLLPAGWLEVGGSVVSAETLTALAALSPDLPAETKVGRALLMARDGAAPRVDLADELRTRGVEVREAAGSGWGGMVNHPERSELSEETVDLVNDWLRDGRTDALPSTAEAHPSSILVEDSILDTSSGVRESPLTIEHASGQLFGILSEPRSSAHRGVAGVLLNAGAIRHIGPNRLWVEAARSWAEMGVPTLRLDLAGIGESDGDELSLREAGDFYEGGFDAQVVAALDALEARGIGDSFLLAGLCAGAYWSARVGLRDRRVESVVMLNGGALNWGEGTLKNREAHRFKRAMSLEWWLKLIRGSIRRPGVREVIGLVFAKVRKTLGRLRERLGGSPRPSSRNAADLDQLEQVRTRLMLAFSGGEALAAELAEEGVLGRIGDWPSAATCELPGNDHTLRTVAAQRAALDLLDSEMRRLLGGRPQSP